MTALDTSGDTTWSPAGGVSGWTISGSTLYETAPTSNIGIGTSTPQGALVVTNGNVGIGTWAPIAPLTVGANVFTVNSAGAITATTGITQNGSGPNTFAGNVGIGTT